MLPNVNISLAGHAIHLTSSDLAVAGAVIFALIVVEVSFSLGRRAALRRFPRTDLLLAELERIGDLVERIVGNLGTRPGPPPSISEESLPPTPPSRPAEWQRPRHAISYSMFGR